MEVPALPRVHPPRAAAFWAASLVFCVALSGRLRAVPGQPLRPWNSYRVIIWIGDSPHQHPDRLALFFQRMTRMAVNTGMVYDGADPAPILRLHFPYYVENIVNRGLCLKWNSNVTDWDRFITRWGRTRDRAALVRDYSLDDPAWRHWAETQVRETVDRNRAFAPVAYNLRDELSVTVSANPFDYDFAPVTLRRFRDWLRSQYPDLAALNREWQTAFKTWEAVEPFTTDQIKNRMASVEALPRGQPAWQALERLKFDPRMARSTPTRWNLAPWADFRTYMDVSLARTLADLRRVAHVEDPHTPVGIEGTQMPAAFGGYDLWRLSRVLDWVEPYDIGNAREIFESFMPGKPILTTVAEHDARRAQRRLWHLLLNGDRGCIVWWSEDCIDWRRHDWPLTSKGKALAPVLAQMTGPLARLILRARRQFDPIAIQYSQPSIQADWLLETMRDGATWVRRFSSFEAGHNRMVQVRDSWLKALQDLGYSPQFVASEQLETGALEQKNLRLLVLPDSLALSDREAEQIREFLQAAGPRGIKRAVFCDGTPGLFDQHAKLRPRSPLEGWFPASASAERSYAARSEMKPGQATAKPGDIADYAAARLRAKPPTGWTDWIGAQAGFLPPAVTVRAVDARDGPPRVAVYRFRLGQARIIAFERNIDYQMGEDLRQAGGNRQLEVPIRIMARFDAPVFLYDLRSRRYLGRTDQAAFTLDPWRPTILALLQKQLSAETVVEHLLGTR